MNVKKLLAIVLAVLMVLPVLVVPTAAEDTDPYTVHHEFNQFDESETPYSVKTPGGKTTSGQAWSGHSHNNDEAIWKFPLNNPSELDDAANKLTSFTIKARTRGEMAIQLSLDGTVYTDAYSILTDPNLSSTASSDEFKYVAGQGLAPYVRTYDLTDTLAKLWVNNPKAEYVYLKLPNVPEGQTSTVNGYTSVKSWEGFFLMYNEDGSLCPVQVDIAYDPDEYVKVPTSTKLVFTPGSNDGAYLYGMDASSNATCYYLDENSGNAGKRHVTYLYDLSGYSLPSLLTWTASVGQNLILELSVDRAHWVELYNNTPNRNDKRYRTFDITEVYAEQQELYPTNLLFIRLRNSNPGKTWGGSIEKQPVTLEIVADKVEVTNGITFMPSVNDVAYKYGDYGVDSNDRSFCLNETPGDQPNYIQYVYALTNSELPSKLAWKASIGQNLILDFSVDNFHWVELCNDVVGDVAASEYRTYDITEAYAEEVAKYPSNMLYIRLRNSRPGQDYGARIDKLPVTLEIEYPERELSGEQINFEYTVRGDSEKPYLVGAPSLTGTTGYFADRLAEIKYKFPLSDADTSSEILLTATNCNKFDIQVSVDDINWVTAFKYSDVGLNAGLSDHPKPNQTIYDKKERTFDLTAAVKKAGELADAQGNLKSMLLFRVVNAHPYLINADGTLNTSKTTGWGGQIHGNVKLSIRMSSDMGVAAEASRVIMEDVAPNDTAYQFVGQEPMLVSASEAGHVASLSQNISATKVDTETMTTTGDGNWNGRYGDNGAYWVYRYELSPSAKSFAWQATVGGQYGIYLAYGDENCPNVMDATQWTLVKDYMGGGAAATDTPNPVAMTISDEINADKLAKGGYVYLLFTDYSWWRANVTHEDEADAKSGYGPRVCFGSNYPVTLSYIMSIDESVKSAGMKWATLNLTENFNLIFNPSVPLASDDAVIEIGFKGETMSVMEPEEDGTYRFDDILPQRMGDTVVFRMSGTIAGLEDFNYELEYSVKQYCMNMLGEKAEDAELCQLLRDILSYGAAVQAYNGYKTDALVNDGITDREFQNSGLRGVYAGTIVGTGKSAEWVSGALTLENITQVVFKFRADDVTDLKAVVTKNTGEKLVFDAADFTPAGVDENGKQLWSLSVPMMACEYHTGLVATFATAGTEDADMDHYLIYSVNTYVSKMHGQGEAALDTLLGAIYNYGESTLEYVAALNK